MKAVKRSRSLCCVAAFLARFMLSKVYFYEYSHLMLNYSLVSYYY